MKKPIDKLESENKELLAALQTLADSLTWEEKRSGTTYHGFETAIELLKKHRGTK